MKRTVFILFLGFLLTACSEEFQDLKDFVKESDKGPRVPVAPLPEVKPYEPFIYSAFDLPDPFKPRRIEPVKGAGASKLQPDLNRRKEALEAFPLENLRMVGTLERGKAIYALIKSPDNNLYRVTTGNYMGQNFGLVTAVTESSLTLKELVQDSIGDWSERQSSLQLLDDQGGKK
ncbi:MAG TPA: pilus assembly protein PilP [Burkholderiales bacterium]|nr:pilus assembly protein PilP [Burkholderiales bacterium]